MSFSFPFSSFRSEFGQAVAKEYLNFFEFEGMSLVDGLRQFLSNFSLTGESQERERVIQHFSRHYHACNPASLPDEGTHTHTHPHPLTPSPPPPDTTHGMTVALLLLNTDLHADVSVHTSHAPVHAMHACTECCVPLQHGGARMTFSQFVTNLDHFASSIPRDVLKVSILSRLLTWWVGLLSFES